MIRDRVRGSQDRTGVGGVEPNSAQRAPGEDGPTRFPRWSPRACKSVGSTKTIDGLHPTVNRICWSNSRKVNRRNILGKELRDWGWTSPAERLPKRPRVGKTDLSPSVLTTDRAL